MCNIFVLSTFYPSNVHDMHVIYYNYVMVYILLLGDAKPAISQRDLLQLAMNQNMPVATTWEGMNTLTYMIYDTNDDRRYIQYIDIYGLVARIPKSITSYTIARKR